MVPELIACILLIVTSVSVIWLISKLVTAVQNPMSKSDICHCKLWHTSCETKVGWHINDFIRQNQNYEITQAFKYVELSVRSLKSAWLPQAASAEQILRVALKKMGSEVLLVEQLNSAREKEYSWIATSLKNAWPLLAPKADLSRHFVEQFCQNLKAKKDSFYALVEKQHSFLEYLSYLTNTFHNFCNIMDVFKKYFPQISKKDRLLVQSNIKNFRKGIRTLQPFFKDTELNLMSSILKEGGIKRIVAIDTEMVGGGFKGRTNMLGRVSLVDKNVIIYDKYVKPIQPVTDYRTFVSGITAEDLKNGEEFVTVQQEVRSIINDWILVGHDLEKDLSVLGLTHPAKDIRDTACYAPFRTVPHEKPSLKSLARSKLGRDVQTGEHDSVEDARVAMDLYLTDATVWEFYQAIKNYQTS